MRKYLPTIIVLLLLAGGVSASWFTDLFSPKFGATVLFPYQGGTGTGTAPTYGQLLVGNAGGTYTLTPTSTLGLLINGGSMTSGYHCRWDGTGIDCDRLEDASGACAANSVCMGGHTHVGVNEVYGSGWDADTATPEKDDVYDWGHAFDTNDDGKVEVLGYASSTQLTPGIIFDKDGQAGSAGQVLSSTATGLDWIAAAAGGGGGGGIGWASTTEDILIYNTDGLDTNPYTVLIQNNGTSATTTTGKIFEVIGNSELDQASTTMLTVSGNAYLATVKTGTWEGTAIGDAYITKTGDWTGTFDGQQGTYYLDAANLTNFGTPFYTLFNGTTTDALDEGSSNLYWSDTLWDNRMTGTTTLPSITTLANLSITTSNVSNIATYWDGRMAATTTLPNITTLANLSITAANISNWATAWDTRLAASSSVASITTLSNLTSIGTIATGVWQGTSIAPAYGGTGLSTGGLKATFIPIGNGTSAFATSSTFSYDTTNTRLAATYASTTAVSGTGLNFTNIGAFTLQGAITGNAQNITGLGQLTVTGVGTASTFVYSSTTGATITNLWPTNLYATTLQGNITGNSKNITGVTSFGASYASTTQLTVTDNAYLASAGGSVGIGTTSPGSIFSVNGVTNFTTVTSTFVGTGGINLKSGCFAINGSCVGVGAGSGTVTSVAMTVPEGLSLSGSPITAAGTLALTFNIKETFIPFGGSGGVIATSSNFLYTTGTGVLSYPYASSTAISGTGLNFTNIGAFTLQGDVTGNSKKITALDQLTVTGTGLASTFIYSSTTGATVTNLWATNLLGALDAGGATSLEIPNGAAVFTNTTGQMAIDTTSGQLRFNSGSATSTLVGYYTMSFNISSSTWGVSTTTVYMAPAPSAITVVSVRCQTSAGTLNVSLWDGTNRANLLNASTTIGTFTYSTNNTFTDAEGIKVDVGTAASSPTAIGCRFKYTFTAD